MATDIITNNNFKIENKISIKESKKLYLDYIRNNCSKLKNVKFFYNNIHLSLNNYTYFTLEFTNFGVKLIERIYIKDGKMMTHLETFPLDANKEALNYLVQRYL